MSRERTESVVVFGQAWGDQKLLRSVSAKANELVQEAVGSKMGFGLAVTFMLNSLTGLSLLTLPYGFAQSGFLVGALLLFLCMLLAFVTATFMCEALTIANALTYEEAEKQTVLSDPLLRTHLSEEREHAIKTLQSQAGDGGAASPPCEFAAASLQRIQREDTLNALLYESRRRNADNEFKIRERVELGAMGELVLATTGGEKKIATAIYAMVVTFTYGTAAALCVTVNTSAASTFCSAIALVGLVEDDCDVDLIYHRSVFITFCITLPLCFADMQKTKKFMLVIMCLRFIAIFLLLVVASQRSYERWREEGMAEIMKTVPMWQPENFMAVFGNAVFLFGVHHYLPSMISPLEPQRKAPWVIITAFLSCYVLLLAITFTALVAWGGEAASTCSQRVGGHWCSVQPLYNLNFAPLTWMGGGVGVFLLAYPAMAIASLPIAAITTRNTMGRWLGIAPANPEAPYTRTNILMTLSVLVPPFGVAYVTKDVQQVIAYVGGYAGLTVAIVCPMVLLMRCRKVLSLDEGKLSGTKRPLKSPFGNPLGYTVVTIFYLVSLALVTKKLFFTA